MVDPSKVVGVFEWVRPTTPSKIQKTVVFLLTDECEVSFQKLNNLLTSAPIITLCMNGVEFMVYWDASGVGIGGELMQKRRVRKHLVW